MKRTIAPVEEDIRYLLDWLSTGLLWLGVTVTVHAVFWGIGRHWIPMSTSGLFAAYVFLSSVLVHRRADRYRAPARRKAVVPSRYKTEETP